MSYKSFENSHIDVHLAFCFWLPVENGSVFLVKGKCEVLYGVSQ